MRAAKTFNSVKNCVMKWLDLRDHKNGLEKILQIVPKRKKQHQILKILFCLLTWIVNLARLSTWKIYLRMLAGSDGSFYTLWPDFFCTYFCICFNSALFGMCWIVWRTFWGKCRIIWKLFSKLFFPGRSPDIFQTTTHLITF